MMRYSRVDSPEYRKRAGGGGGGRVPGVLIRKLCK